MNLETSHILLSQKSRLTPTQRQKQNLIDKKKKRNEDKIYSQAMEEACLEYDKTIKLRKEGKVEHGLRFIINKI